MAWLQLTIDPARCDPEDLEATLDEVGALAITLADAGDQPLLEPGVGETPLWREVTMTVLFDTNVDTEAVEAAVGARGARAGNWESIEDRAWEREWLQRFAPRRFGKRLWVVPGDATAPDPDAAIVRLDPGLAFGTGDHPTTAMCLSWLGDRTVDGLDVLDFGCGSGILAIAALRLGAASAAAVDIDPQAVTATRDNAARNGVSERVYAGYPTDVAGRRYDLVLANILAGPLVELAPTLVAHLRPGASIVLSGILATQASSVRAAYAGDIDWTHEREQDEWALVAGQRKARG